MRHAFLDHHSTIESPIHNLDARAKIIVFFTFILVGVSSQPNSFLLFSLLVIFLISIALLARLPLFHLLKKVLVILPFLFVVTLSVPFFKKDGVGGGIQFRAWRPFRIPERSLDSLECGHQILSRCLRHHFALLHHLLPSTGQRIGKAGFP